MSERSLAVITGASAGIGEAIAREAVRDGYAVLLVARRGDRLAALAAELPGEAHTVEADLATPEGPVAVSDALSRLGRPADVLVNNAGVGQSGPFVKGSAARDLAMVDLNVRAVVDLTHRLLPSMVERGRGGVLNVASLAAYQPGPNAAIYYATKSFVLSFSEALHTEVRGHGVTVSALCPGPVATEFFALAGMDNVLLRKVARALSPERVAAEGWRGLAKGRRVILPGLGPKVRAATAGLTPRVLELPMVKALQSRPKSR
ncbi:MAG: SDR family oxidoreductase [Pseudomonadota bacterium]